MGVYEPGFPGDGTGRTEYRHEQARNFGGWREQLNSIRTATEFNLNGGLHFNDIWSDIFTQNPKRTFPADWSASAGTTATTTTPRRDALVVNTRNDAGGVRAPGTLAVELSGNTNPPAEHQHASTAAAAAMMPPSQRTLNWQQRTPDKMPGGGIGMEAVTPPKARDNYVDGRA
jgi:hypothetical protein